MHDMLDPDDAHAAPPHFADRLDELCGLSVSQAAADLVEQDDDGIGR